MGQEGVSKWKEKIRQHQEVGRGSEAGSQGSRRHWLLCRWRQDGTGQGTLRQDQGVARSVNHAGVGKASQKGRQGLRCGSAEERASELRHIACGNSTWLSVLRRSSVGKFVHVNFP